jgi:type II secretory pathway component PulK
MNRSIASCRMAFRSRAQRRGAAILVAVAILVVAVALVGTTLQQLVATQRAARTAGRKLQAQWLAESALDRAIAKRRLDSRYRGEAWKPPTTAVEQGVAHIEIREMDGRAMVSITADFPNHPTHRARVQLERPLP